jgi:hypothetical protein
MKGKGKTQVKKEKEYICNVELVFSGNNIVAKDEKEYIVKVKESFKDEYNIDLDDKEIGNIERMI